MANTLKTILVPVDFSLNTEVAVARSLSLLGAETAGIHLLHVFQPALFSNQQPATEECIRKLKQWKTSLVECRPDLSVSWHLKKGFSVQATIRQAAAELSPDMIVVGQSACHTGFFHFLRISPVNLAKTTGIPVLTVKPGSMPHRPKTVVVPVSDAFPESKMQALAILCRHTRLSIHLITVVTGQEAPSDRSASTLLQSYQWLKTTLHCPVDFAVVHGGNRAQAILHYAEQKQADVLLVQPEKETRLGWGDRHIPDVLPSGSRMQVLAVTAARY